MAETELLKKCKAILEKFTFGDPYTNIPVNENLPVGNTKAPKVVRTSPTYLKDTPHNASPSLPQEPFQPKPKPQFNQTLRPEETSRKKIDTRDFGSEPEVAEHDNLEASPVLDGSKPDLSHASAKPKKISANVPKPKATPKTVDIYSKYAPSAKKPGFDNAVRALGFLMSNKLIDSPMGSRGIDTPAGHLDVQWKMEPKSGRALVAVAGRKFYVPVDVEEGRVTGVSQLSLKRMQTDHQTRSAGPRSYKDMIMGYNLQNAMTPLEGKPSDYRGDISYDKSKGKSADKKALYAEQASKKKR